MQCEKRGKEEDCLEESQTAAVIRKLGLASVSRCPVTTWGQPVGTGVSAGAGW